MKKVSIILMLAMVLAGGVMGAIPTPAQAQVYMPTSPPPRPAAEPWVGQNTLWVYYQGDWFMNGILYLLFGDKLGWAPYYAYAPTYIARPNNWYAPRWNAWYKAHPVYWTNFHRQYPHWQGHQPGRRYDQNFYNQYHHGQGGGWQKGSQAGAYNPAPPAKGNQHPETMGTGHGPLPQGQPEQYQPGPPSSR